MRTLLPKGARGCWVVACEEPHYQGDYCKEHYEEWVNDGSPEEWRPKVPVTPLTAWEMQRLQVEAHEKLVAEAKVRAQVHDLGKKLAKMHAELLARATRVSAAFAAARAEARARRWKKGNEKRKLTRKVRVEELDAEALAELQRARTRELYAQRRAEALAGNGPTCMIPNCTNPHSSQELCVTHYGQWVSDGRPDLITWKPHVTQGDMPCGVTDCKITAIARGYCKKHWQKWKLLGFPAGWRGEGYKVREFCTVPNCGGKHKSFGYCIPHYAAWKKDGRPVAWAPRLPASRKVGISECRVAGCTYDAFSNRLCKAHRARWRREDEPDLETWNPPLIKTRGSKRLCKVPQCGRDHNAHGYCHGHDQQWSRLGKPSDWNPPDGPPSRD